MLANVIYHGGCPDGFAAFWVAQRSFGGEVNALPMGYNQPIPEELDPNLPVYIVDFSFDRETTIELANMVPFVVILDHHKTAEAALVDLPGNVHVTFDMERSGAGITWDHFNPGRARPILIDYVEDRDLWRFNLDRSREVGAWIMNLEHNIPTWDAAMGFDIQDLFVLGGGAWETRQALCRAASHQSWLAYFPEADIVMPIVNVSYFVASEVAEMLCEKWNTDAAAYFLENKHGVWQYGFRSRNGFDVSEVAKIYGGGGHASAAGCTSETRIDERVSNPSNMSLPSKDWIKPIIEEAGEIIYGK